MHNKYTLYGWEVSPYTAKIDAYLRYKKIPFVRKIPNAYTLLQTFPKQVGKTIMPVLRTPEGQLLQDSSHIIDVLEERYPSPSTLTFDDPIKTLMGFLLELHGDEWLCMLSLHYRWHYRENIPFLYKELGKSAAPYFPHFIQKKMVQGFVNRLSGYPSVLGINEHNQQALEDHAHQLFTTMNELLGKQAYLQGESPTHGDFSVFGHIYAHLHRDPFPKDLIRQYQNLFDWMEAMKTGDKRIPSSSETQRKLILKLLRLLGEYHSPLLKSSIESLEVWAQTQSPDTKIPQALGKTQLSLTDPPSDRVNQTYVYWMIQRAQDYLLALPQDALKELQAFRQQLPAADILLTPLKFRVSLSRCRLYLQSA